MAEWCIYPSPPHIPLCPLWCSAQGRWQNNQIKLWICLQSFWCVSLPDMCIATAISLLMILICAMATYGAYKVIYYVQWRYNSVETKLRKLLSNNLLFSCLAENWEKKSIRDKQNCLCRSVLCQGPTLQAGRLPTGVDCLQFQIHVSSGQTANSENWILFLPKLREFFSHSPTKSVVCPNINAINEGAGKCYVVFKCPSIMSCGNHTAHTTAVQQPNWLGQLFWLKVILLLADLTSYFLLWLHEM